MSVKDNKLARLARERRERNKGVVFEEPTIEGLAVELQKAQALGLKAPTPIVPRHAASATAGVSREAILSQLDNLSAAELQSLLNSMLESKHPA